MIDEAVLDQWAASAISLTAEQIQMLISQLRAYQRNSTIVYVFPQTFFDVSNNKIGTPDDATITPDKLRGFVLERAANADYYFASATKQMPQDKPAAPPVIVPQPKPLYSARVTADFLTLRDQNGKDGYGELLSGEIVEVWEIRADIGGKANRAIINAPDANPRLNVWANYIERVY